MSAEHAFVTLTLARICAAQGKLARAKEIYEQLLATEPADVQLERELQEVDQRLLTAAERAEPVAEWISLAPQHGGIECRWLVTEEAIERARLLLGEDGALSVRCATFPFDPGLSLRDTNVDSLSGALFISKPGGALLAAASIGLLSSRDRFVSMAHCRTVAVSETAQSENVQCEDV